MKKRVEFEAGTMSGPFELDDFLPYRLAIASETVSRLIGRRHLDRLGLGMPEWRLLAAVGRYNVLSPTIAGERTGMDKVKVSRAAAGLVSRGLMRQGHDPNDGRGRLLRLTRKGASLFADLPATAGAIQADLSAGLTKVEWTTLEKSLGKLAEHAKMLLEAAASEDDA